MCLSLPKRGCKLCPRGRVWATHYCARCNAGVCVKHATFDSDSNEWRCLRCGPTPPAPIDIAARREAKQHAVNRTKRPPIWEEALAA